LFVKDSKVDNFVFFRIVQPGKAITSHLKKSPNEPKTAIMLTGKIFVPALAVNSTPTFKKTQQK